MAPTLYMIPRSPAVRAVQITAKALGIEFDEKPVEILKGEHLKPEYLKINPQHTVPALEEDDGFVIWDSHAINPYLVSKYGKDDCLYPKDLKKRAMVDLRLHFDSGTLFSALAEIVRPMFRVGKNVIYDTDKEKANQVYAFLEAFLDGNPWVAGDSKTIADYNLYATMTSFDVVVPVDCQKFTKIAAWLEKMEALPEVEVSKKGLQAFEEMIKSKLQS